MKSVFDISQRIAPIRGVFGELKFVLPGYAKCYSCLQRCDIPTDYESREESMVVPGSDTKEVNDRYSILHRLSQPAVVCCIGVLAHERVINRLVAFIDLLVHLSLVVVPDPGTGSGKDRFDREQILHLLRLEDSTPGINKRNAVALKLETGAEITRRQIATRFGKSRDRSKGCESK